MKNKKIKMRQLQVKKLPEVKNLVETAVKEEELRRERKIKTIE